MIEDPKCNIDIITFNKKDYTEDASFIYRGLNLASVLRQKNTLGFIGYVSDYHLSENTRYVILLRPIYSIPLRFLIRKLKKKGVKVIADVDDLIIHPDFASESPAVRNNILSEQKISKQFDRNYKALKLCDHILCSTSKLKSELGKYFNVPITVMHNCVFHNWNSGIEEPNNESKKTITYFSGTKSHDKDFKLIEKPLVAYLGDTPNATLKIVGPLRISMTVSKKQLIHIPKVPFQDYDKLVKMSSLNLAPLEESIFNNCKSALKAIEAGAFGTPTIFSPNEDAVRFENSSVFIANTEADWYDHLKHLFDNDTFNQSKCLEGVEAKANIEKMAMKFNTDVLDCV